MKMSQLRKRRIFIATYGAGHVKALLPVIQKLIATGDFEVDVLGLTTANAELHRLGIPAIGFRDIVRPQDAGFLRDAERLLTGNSHPDVTREETLAYMGLSYYDLQLRVGPEEATKRYAQEGRNCFLPVTFLLRYLAETRPDLVITTTSPRAERAAIEAAAILGLPSVVLLNSFPNFDLEYVKQAHYGTRVCVICDAVKDVLCELGRDPESIVVTGDPGFDTLNEPPSAEQLREFRTRRDIGDRKIVFWASQPEPEMNDFTGESGDPTLPVQVDRYLVSCLERHEDWYVIIRLHPAESRTISGLPARASHHQRSEDLKTLLFASDVVITFSSTVGVEAAVIGKPVLFLTQSTTANYSALANYKLGHPVASLEELEPAIAKTLLSSRTGDLPAGLPLGRAADRIVDIIGEIIGTSGR